VLNGEANTLDEWMNEPAKTISELVFEDYLRSHNVTGWDYEPEVSGKKQRPDYRLRSRDAEIFFEVKEFHHDPKQPLPRGNSLRSVQCNTRENQRRS